MKYEFCMDDLGTVITFQFDLRVNSKRYISFVSQLLPVCKISAEKPFLQATDFLDSNKLLTADSKANILHGTY